MHDVIIVSMLAFGDRTCLGPKRIAVSGADIPKGLARRCSRWNAEIFERCSDAQPRHDCCDQRRGQEGDLLWEVQRSRPGRRLYMRMRMTPPTSSTAPAMRIALTG